MILPDWKIKEYIEDEVIRIRPFSEENLQPHSYDITLGGKILLPRESPRGKIRYLPMMLPVRFPRDEFALGTSIEYIELPSDICAQVDGKSTLGRLGLSNHQTAGWIDAGFHGNITLELSNASSIPIRLEEGMRIGQIIFMETEDAKHPYGTCNNHYQNQKGVTAPNGINDLYIKK